MGVFAYADEARPKGEANLAVAGVHIDERGVYQFARELAGGVVDDLHLAGRLAGFQPGKAEYVIGIEPSYPSVGTGVGVAAHLVLQLMKFVHSEPERLVNLPKGGLLQLLENGQQGIDPPVKVVATQRLGVLDNGVPVGGGALEDDGRDAAHLDGGIVKVAFEGGHGGDLRGREGGGGAGGEAGGEGLGELRAHDATYLTGKLFEIGLPGFARPTDKRGWHIQPEGLLALKIDKQGAQLLGVGGHMLGKALADEEPDGIGRDDDGAMVGIGLLHGTEEGVALLDEGLAGGADGHNLGVALVVGSQLLGLLEKAYVGESGTTKGKLFHLDDLLLLGVRAGVSEGERRRAVSGAARTGRGCHQAPEHQ